MSEHPIIFSGPMVRAILEGRKTQTRRVIKPQPPAEIAAAVDHWCDTGEIYGFGKIAYDDDGKIIWPLCGGLRPTSIRCPYGIPGDRLFVKEGYRIDHGIVNRQAVDGVYLADQEPFACCLSAAEWTKWQLRKWRYRGMPGRFMYKSLARLWLEVTAVHVERVQEISRSDCIAEGIEAEFHGHPISGLHHEFAALWGSINGKRGYGWESNPWVRCVLFKVADGVIKEATDGQNTTD